MNNSYLQDAIDRFAYYKDLGERALQQTTDDSLFIQLDPLSNSIATIVKHLSGNMRSRWTDFLTTDGEKPDRDRDGEFEVPPVSRGEVIALWEVAWKVTFASLAQLTETDLEKTVTMRGKDESVIQATNRQITHCSYHVGQIVFLAKHFAGPKWNILTVPRGKSKDYAARVRSGELSGR